MTNAVTTFPQLPDRDPRGHKGTFGTVAIIGGSCEGHSRMVGAPVLAARAALRSGAGLARLVMPAPILVAGLSMLPSATGLELPTEDTGAVSAHDSAEILDSLLPTCDAVVIGPGLGAAPSVQSLVLRVVQQEVVPAVLDADALNAMALIPELHRDFRVPAVLTPHPGEFTRLARAFRITADPTDPATRPKAAEELAQRLGCVVVLKGAGTVVSDGYRTWICGEGHHCLATAGTGDVLAGLIGGLIAQFVRLVPKHSGSFGLFEAAQVAVRAHARAGERWAHAHGGGAGLLASELADLLPGAIGERSSH